MNLLIKRFALLLVLPILLISILAVITARLLRDITKVSFILFNCYLGELKINYKKYWLVSWNGD